MSSVTFICTLCTNSIDDNDRIICPHCSIEICEKCHQYSITMELQNPTCVYCKKTLSIEFILSNNTTKWCKEVFLTYYSELLVEQEKTKLADTIPKFKATKELRNLKIERRNLKTNIQIKKTFNKSDLRPFIKEMSLIFSFTNRDIEKYNLNEKINELTIRLNNGKNEIKDKDKDKKIYITNCPQQECNGFINNEYFCDLCDTEICEKCMIIKNNDHICNRNDIKSANLIKESSKSCPKCYTSIFKISGCNQMFCTSCHCVFDWVTLKIDSGSVHNQHYYDWISSLTNPSEQTNIEITACGDINDLYPQIIHRIYRNSIIHRVFLVNRELVTDIIPYLNNKFKNNYEKYRIEFLDNKLSIEKWKQKLIKDLIFNESNNSYIDILNMFIAITSDFIRKLCYEINNITYSNIVNNNNDFSKNKKISQYIDNISSEIHTFISHFKTCLLNTYTTFNHNIDKDVERLFITTLY